MSFLEKGFDIKLSNELGDIDEQLYEKDNTDDEIKQLLSLMDEKFKELSLSERKRFLLLLKEAIDSGLIFNLNAATTEKEEIKPLDYDLTPLRDLTDEEENDTIRYHFNRDDLLSFKPIDIDDDDIYKR